MKQAAEHERAAPWSPGPMATAWMFLCPLAAAAGVALWITQRDPWPQYAAVAANFGYFLALVPTLARGRVVADAGDSPARPAPAPFAPRGARDG